MALERHLPTEKEQRVLKYESLQKWTKGYGIHWKDDGWVKEAAGQSSLPLHSTLSLFNPEDILRYCRIWGSSSSSLSVSVKVVWHDVHPHKMLKQE